jgi:hypothetical protein
MSEDFTASIESVVHLRLDDGTLATVDDVYFGGIDVDADHVVPGVSKTRR